ncbi:HupE/UreJ family protein [Paenibacillus psychroresistens]|uniref:HupE/UreJ family protein n=1 Tax=Paenibacillus psychroresistens TaxID=1778678 RepID=A0A6B8RS74_9BACL|nr:HupE/UreJ family protein [Paenibacillus psychroresistens]QGQ98747.1 HupE/UreJ family protein [Paenibacillus psychroresistens]
MNRTIFNTGKKTLVILAVTLALFMSFTSLAWAHFTSTGYSDITVEANTLKYGLFFSDHDLIQIFPADKDGDDKLSNEELAGSMDKLSALIDDGLILTGDGKLGKGIIESASRVKRASMDMIGINIQYNFEAPVKLFMVQYDFFWYGGIDPAHRNYATIHFGSQTIEQVLNSENYIIQLQGADTAPAATSADTVPAVTSNEPVKNLSTSWMTTLRTYTVMGMEHIWSGIDHMLFLLGLVLASDKRKWNVVKLISAFTVGHCITLALSSFELAYLSPKIVEPLIALSIVYIAVENIWKRKQNSPIGVTLLFGLVHGFGFAEILRGTLTDHMALPLFSFNLGVEFGQLAVLAVIIPALWALGRIPVKINWVRYGSGIIGVFGLIWLIERIVSL